MICSKSFWTLAFVLTIGVGQYACSLPVSSRTAKVYDVKIDETLSPENLQVQPGDEIRWVNFRKQEALLEIPNIKADDLACQREFTNWMGSLQEATVLKSEESASLCFSKPAVVNYNVRVDTAQAGSKKVLNGVVKVGTSSSQ